MASLEPVTVRLPGPDPSPTPVPAAASAYWRFDEAVAADQLAAWAPKEPARILELSGDGPHRAEQLREAGHDVVRVGATTVAGVTTVNADSRSLGWLVDGCFDAVVAESRALSLCLATEETARDLARIVRPGGRLLLVVDSLLTGLARLADQGRWAELADVASADVVLVPDAHDGPITRCFSARELSALLTDNGLEVEWVRPRSVLTPGAVESGLLHGGSSALRTLVTTELALAHDHEGETTGMHLVASARRPW